MRGNILIIDDEKKIRKVYREILKKEGFFPFEAGDAVAGREVLMHRKIDMVLLDLNMPGIRGEELFHVMRAFHKECEVIVSSVYPISVQKKAAFNADDFFDKSDGLKALVEKIKHHFDSTGDKRQEISIAEEEKVSFFIAVC